MRRCLLEDFGDGDHAEHVFDIWKDFLILCPITKGKKDKLKLWGHRGMMETSTFDLRLGRCVNKASCKNETEIDYFLRDLEVDTWSFQEIMDFNRYG